MKNEENATIKSRLKSFATTNSASVREFEQRCNLSNGYIGRGGDIGSDKIETIVKEFPNINLRWLFTGDGEMELNGEDLNDKNSLKVYIDTPVTAGNIEDLPSDNVANFTRMKIPGFDGCVGLIASGDSMYPTIKDGDVVVIEPIPVETIINGHIYIIVTRDGQRAVKRLTKVKEDGRDIVRCFSDNTDKELYAPFDVEGGMVLTIYKVKGYFSFKVINI